uniref:C2H2-type domain-containing protein n=1 Tax=Anopheles epiroticus TaxID=199890 RepID=A0A182P760_9DIPT
MFFVCLVYIAGCSPKKLFSCQLCGKVLCSKASLKRHIADKHAERQEEYRCIICERVYCSRNSLMTHIYTYHKSRPGELDMKDVKFF